MWWLDYYEDFRLHLASRYAEVKKSTDYVIFDVSPRPALP